MEVQMAELISLWDEIPFGIIILDSKGKILGWKGEMRNWFLSEEEEVSKKFLAEVLPEVNVSRERFRQLEENRWETIIKTSRFPLRGEWKHASIGGKPADLLILRRDELYFELESIFESSFDEILVTDGEGRILYAGPKSEQLYNRPFSELMGKKTTEIAEEGGFTPSLIPEILKHKKRVSGVQVTASGNKIYVTGNPVLDRDGNILRIVFNSRDEEEVELLRQRLETTENLLETYRNQLGERKQGGSTQDQDELVILSPAMNKVYQVSERVSKVDSSVLITGESGVGKGVIAHLVHRIGIRQKQKFVHINCGAIPETLIESELFGYEKGAFTGAQSEKKGILEVADGGTVFLDEIGEIPLNVQVKLLQFLQNQTFRRLGGNKLIRVNTRVIAATNQNLPELVDQGRFRQDLYYRLNVIHITVPPLRERREEIPALIQHNLSRLSKRYGLFKGFHESTVHILTRCDWPGNIRELENLVERLVVTVEGTEIKPEHLPEDYQGVSEDVPGSVPPIQVGGLYPLKLAVEEVERQLLSLALKKYGNTYRCAEALRVNQSTVVRKIKKYPEIKEG